MTIIINLRISVESIDTRPHFLRDLGTVLNQKGSRVFLIPSELVNWLSYMLSVLWVQNFYIFWYLIALREVYHESTKPSISSAKGEFLNTEGGSKAWLMAAAGLLFLASSPYLQVL